jgi:hypothetical protein
MKFFRIIYQSHFFKSKIKREKLTASRTTDLTLESSNNSIDSMN